MSCSSCALLTALLLLAVPVDLSSHRGCKTGITIASDHPHKTVSYKEHSRATVDTHAFVFQLDHNPTAIPDSDRNPLGGEVKQCKWMPYIEVEALSQAKGNYTLQRCVRSAPRPPCFFFQIFLRSFKF